MEKVFAEEFSNAKIQRCQVHVARNILCKVPVKLKKEVADDVRSIFYASTKEKAKQFLEDFEIKWESVIPSAIKCLKTNAGRCLTYLNFEEEYWVSLRTTNPIERLNKEYKRRTKPMEIVAGEASLYNILGFVSVKMEIGWMKAPIQSDGKKAKRFLPDFTQKT